MSKFAEAAEVSAAFDLSYFVGRGLWYIVDLELILDGFTPHLYQSTTIQHSDDFRS